MDRTGIVIIGRNEGSRLRRCLESVCGSGRPVVYVDSGSTDDSVGLARSMGVEVVELEMSRPFTAARARNAGFERLMALCPDTDVVQFVDGDCEVRDGWLATGAQMLASHPDVAIVAGRLKEKCPQASVYNRLCAMEWERLPGEVKACGGIFMIRTRAFQEVGGFREDVMAAEDDELCLRLRRKGWKIIQLDSEMATHDAAMTRFGQWWRRARRMGYAYAQGAHLHGASADRHFVRDCVRVMLWSTVVPLVAVVFAVLISTWGLILLGSYALLGMRIYRYGRGRGWSPHDAILYASFNILAKWPALLGMMQYALGRWGCGRRLIEYKEIVRST